MSVSISEIPQVNTLDNNDLFLISKNGINPGYESKAIKFSTLKNQSFKFPDYLSNNKINLVDNLWKLNGTILSDISYDPQISDERVFIASHNYSDVSLDPYTIPFDCYLSMFLSIPLLESIENDLVSFSLMIINENDTQSEYLIHWHISMGHSSGREFNSGNCVLQQVFLKKNDIIRIKLENIVTDMKIEHLQRSYLIPLR